MVSATGQNSGRGTVYVYQRNGSSWSFVQKLTAAGGQPNDHFGDPTLAVDGNTAIIASRADQISIFVRAGTTWTLQQTLTVAAASTPAWLSGDTILAYNSGWTVYVRNGSTWSVQQTLTPSNETSVTTWMALSGNTAAGVGYHGIHIFVRNGTAWTEQQTIPQEWTVNTGLISLAGDTLLSNYSGLPGMVRVFTRNGSVWTEQQSIPQPSNIMAMYGDTVLLGVPSVISDSPAYFFTRSSGSWMQQAVYNAKYDPSFGGSVALSMDTGIIGHPCLSNAYSVLCKDQQGSVRVYRNDSSLVPLTINSSTTYPSPGVSVDGGDIISGPATLYVSPGQHTVSITPPNRFAFQHWSDGNTSNPRTINVSSSTTLTASLVQQYLLTLNVYPPGSGTVTPSSGYFNAGEKVTITATPAPGAMFASWTGVGWANYTGPSTTAVVTMNADVQETATFLAAASTGLRFVPITPCRAEDTRVSLNGAPVYTWYTFRLRSSPCGLPASAQAYALNVTAVPQQPVSYLTLYPTGTPQVPIASTLNSGDGRIKANAAIVPAGTDGSVTAYTPNKTGVVLDVNGYFDATDPNGLAFYPLPPCRIADTRNANAVFGGPILSAGETRTFPVLASACNIPTAAKAYSLNMTAVPPGPLSYLTVWPSGETRPIVSTLNSPTGVTVANAVLVKGGTQGQINTFVTDPTHLVIDINGYFAPPGPDGLLFYPMTPCRAVDTRGFSGLLPPLLSSPALVGAASRSFPLLTSGCPIDTSALAYSMNVTVVPPAPLGFVTLFPTGQLLPLASTLNSSDMDTVANAAIVPAGNGGAISAYASNAAQIIFDINGYFAP